MMKRRVEIETRQSDISNSSSTVEKGCYGHQMEMFVFEPCADTLEEPKKSSPIMFLANPEITTVHSNSQVGCTTRSKKRAHTSNCRQTQPVERPMDSSNLCLVEINARKGGAVIQNVPHSGTSVTGSHRPHSDFDEYLFAKKSKASEPNNSNSCRVKTRSMNSWEGQYHENTVGKGCMSDSQIIPSKKTFNGSYRQVNSQKDMKSTQKENKSLHGVSANLPTTRYGSSDIFSGTGFIKEVNNHKLSLPKVSENCRSGKYCVWPTEESEILKNYGSLHEDLCRPIRCVSERSGLEAGCATSTPNNGVKHKVNEVDSSLDKLENSAGNSCSDVIVMQQKSEELCCVWEAQIEDYSSEMVTGEPELLSGDSICEGFFASCAAKLSNLVIISNDEIKHTVYEVKSGLHLEDLGTCDTLKLSEAARKMASLVGMESEVNDVVSTVGASKNSIVNTSAGVTMKELICEDLCCVWEAGNYQMENLNFNDEVHLLSENKSQIMAHEPLSNQSQLDSESDFVQSKSVRLFGCGRYASNVPVKQEESVNCCVWEAVRDDEEERAFNLLLVKTEEMHEDGNCLSCLNHLQTVLDEGKVILHKHCAECHRKSQSKKSVFPYKEACLASDEEIQNKRCMQSSDLHKNGCEQEVCLPVVLAGGVTGETVDNISSSNESFLEACETDDAGSGALVSSEIMNAESKVFVNKCKHLCQSSSLTLNGDLQTLELLEKSLERQPVNSLVNKSASLRRSYSPLICPEALMSDEDPYTSVSSMLSDDSEPVISFLDKHNVSVLSGPKAVKYVDTSLSSSSTHSCCHEQKANVVLETLGSNSLSFQHSYVGESEIGNTLSKGKISSPAYQEADTIDRKMSVTVVGDISGIESVTDMWLESLMNDVIAKSNQNAVCDTLTELGLSQEPDQMVLETQVARFKLAVSDSNEQRAMEEHCVHFATDQSLRDLVIDVHGSSSICIQEQNELKGDTHNWLVESQFALQEKASVTLNTSECNNEECSSNKASPCNGAKVEDGFLLDQNAKLSETIINKSSVYTTFPFSKDVDFFNYGKINSNPEGHRAKMYHTQSNPYCNSLTGHDNYEVKSIATPSSWTDENKGEDEHGSSDSSIYSECENFVSQKISEKEMDVVECALGLMSLACHQEMCRYGNNCLVQGGNRESEIDQGFTGECTDRREQSAANFYHTQKSDCLFKTSLASTHTYDAINSQWSFNNEDNKHNSCSMFEEHVSPSSMSRARLASSTMDMHKNPRYVSSPVASKFQTHYTKPPIVNLSNTVQVLKELLSSFENASPAFPFQTTDEGKLRPASPCQPSMIANPIHNQSRPCPASDLPVLVAKPGFSLQNQLKISKPNSVSDEKSLSGNASAEQSNQFGEHRTSEDLLLRNSSCASKLSAKASSSAVKSSSEKNQYIAFTEVQELDCHKTALGLRSNPAKFHPFQISHMPNNDKNQSSKASIMGKETYCETAVTSSRLTGSFVSSSASCHSRRRKSVSWSPHCAIDEATKAMVCTKEIFPRGHLVWARLGSQHWWPAMIVSAFDCGKTAPTLDRCWVFWFGDHKISEISCLKIASFVAEYSSKFPSRYSSKNFKLAILEIIKEHARRVGRKLPGTLEEALNWAEQGFVVRKQVNSSDDGEHLVSDVPEWVMKELATIRQQMLQDDSDSSNSHQTDSEDEESTGDCINMNLVLNRVRRGELSIDEICISCGDQEGNTMEQHPFIHGGLCGNCMIELSSAIFTFEKDGISANCIICSNGGRIFLCENIGCNKVYCSSCIRMFGGEVEVQLVLNTNPWYCYLCMPEVCSTSSLLQGRKDWRENLVKLLAPPDAVVPVPGCISDRQPIRVLSLFDGIGTGKLVLNQLGIEVCEYFASEIDESAILVTRVRHGDTVKQLGCVTAITKKTLQSILPIDLLIGGSPCNNLSIANPQRQGLDSDTGSLFFEFCRILSILRSTNPPNRHLYWLFENVASMQCETRDTISRHLNCQPALWDAKHFSAMRRARYFWGNLPDMYCPLQYRQVNAASSSSTLSENLFPSRSAKVLKIRTITTKANSLMQAGKADNAFPVVTADGIADTLWIPEIERVFGFPEHYTDVANLSYSRRQKLLGQAWSVPVIRHLLSALQNCFRSCKNGANSM